MSDRPTAAEGEVDGREYAEWVKDSVIEAATDAPKASWSSSGGYLAVHDQEMGRVLVYRLVEQHDVDDLEELVGDG